MVRSLSAEATEIVERNPVFLDELRTTKSTSDPVYNHCLALWIENYDENYQSKGESISETVIIIFGILFMGLCSNKNDDKTICI